MFSSNSNLSCLNFLFIKSLPWLDKFFLCLLILFLIADFALEVTTLFSQSSEGFCIVEVIIFTWSPLLSLQLIGTSLSSIFAPVHLDPSSEWIEKAKSRIVESIGKVIRSPFGVKTNISSLYKLPLKSSKNSWGE